MQAGDLATMKAKIDESEGQKSALDDHIKTLKVICFRICLDYNNRFLEKVCLVNVSFV